MASLYGGGTNRNAIWNTGRFFSFSGVFRAFFQIGDMIFSAIYGFNFVTFVFLDRALGIVIVTRAFIATGGEMASIRGVREPLTVVILFRSP